MTWEILVAIAAFISTRYSYQPTIKGRHRVRLAVCDRNSNRIQSDFHTSVYMLCENIMTLHVWVSVFVSRMHCTVLCIYITV